MKSPQDKAQARIEELKRQGKLPTLDQWLAAVAEVRKNYQPQILAARELGPEPEELTLRQQVFEALNDAVDNGCESWLANSTAATIAEGLISVDAIEHEPFQSDGDLDVLLMDAADEVDIWKWARLQNGGPELEE